MKRTNTFTVRPLSDSGEQLLRDLLDASAALWNEANYERLMRYNDEDGYKDEDTFEADTGHLEGKYKGVLGAATAQQVIQKNTEAWKSFFRLKEQYYDPEDTSITDHPEPPGFRGNSDEGRELRTVIRNDSYTIEQGNRSRIEILVGQELKDEYGLGYRERLQLELCGQLAWPDWEKQGRLNLWYDEIEETFRASQPVTVPDSERETPLADETAALDIGANNLVACTTTTGQQYLYEGRELFERFRETTHRIAELQSKLPEECHSSKRIQRLYCKRTRRRDHAQEALCRDLLERLYTEGIDTVYVGDLTDVLESHWSVETNAKIHNFWAFRKFVERLSQTAEEYGIDIEARLESYTTQKCPDCGSTCRTTRHKDTLTCSCGFEGHVDLTASKTFLEQQINDSVRLMAQPVRFEWDDHKWSESSRSHRPKEQRTDQSTVHFTGNIASGNT